MFSYYPTYSYNPYKAAAYARAEAEERAAAQQYLAAVRAQEEARERAAHAHRLRQAFANPYSSYLSDNADTSDEESYPYPYPSRSQYGYGITPQEHAALQEEQRRQELLRLEREREHQRLVEEERMRRLMAEAKRRKEQEEERVRSQQEALEGFLSTFGMRAPREQPELNASRRARNTSQSPRRSSPTPAGPSEPVRIPVRDPEPPVSAERVSAAEKIQDFYRTHASRRKALHSIADINSRFQSLKSGFQLPQSLDFQDGEGSVIAVDTVFLRLPTIEEEFATPADELEEEQVAPVVPKLAYSSNNTVLHQYDEELNRLLGQLDAVESGGDRAVRDKRRELVRKVEKEAQRLESWKNLVWNAFKAAQSEPAVDPEFEVTTEVEMAAPDATLPDTTEEPIETASTSPAPKSETDIVVLELPKVATELTIEPAGQVTEPHLLPLPYPGPSEPLALQEPGQLSSSPLTVTTELHASDDITSSPVLVSRHEEPDMDVDVGQVHDGHDSESDAESVISTPSVLSFDAEAEAEEVERELEGLERKRRSSESWPTTRAPQELRRQLSAPLKPLIDSDWRLSDEFVVC